MWHASGRSLVWVLRRCRATPPAAVLDAAAVLVGTVVGLALQKLVDQVTWGVGKVHTRPAASAPSLLAVSSSPPSGPASLGPQPRACPRSRPSLSHDVGTGHRGSLSSRGKPRLPAHRWPRGSPLLRSRRRWRCVRPACGAAPGVMPCTLGLRRGAQGAEAGSARLVVLCAAPAGVMRPSPTEDAAHFLLVGSVSPAASPHLYCSRMAGISCTSRARGVGKSTICGRGSHPAEADATEIGRPGACGSLSSPRHLPTRLCS